MLTPEERTQIEEEERRAHEAEQYRSTFRAKLKQEAAPKDRPKPTAGRWVLITIVAAAAILALAVLADRRSHNGETGQSGVSAAQATPSILVRYVPVDSSIANGQITVPARGYVTYKIVVTSEMVDPVISGNFNASGGLGNDVQAFLSDEPNFENWINAHQASGFWSTEGRETTGSFSVRTPPGTYILALSNKFSVISAKQVFVNFHLSYKRKESALP